MAIVSLSPFSQVSAAPHETGPSAPTIKIAQLQPLKPLPQPDFKPMEEIAPIESPPVEVPPIQTSGCVTGYVSGDYYLDKIIAYESSGSSCNTNPGGCFGLLQACPGQPLKDACGGNPACQIEWFINNKTGGRSWAQVWQHELDYGWW